MDFIQAYRKSINAMLDEHAELIANGSCGTFDEYRSKVGVRKGIQFALNRFDDIVKQYVMEETEDFSD
jgi:hypothetical protein